MKMDTPLAMRPLAHVGRVAKRAEEMGFSGIFTAEALQTPFLPLALAAVETRRLEIGTAIALAFPRSPMVLAMTAWDLHKASKGRMNLGLGTQIRKHIERRFSVPFDPPGPRLRDMLLAIRHIWDCFDGKHALDHHGECYSGPYDAIADAIRAKYEGLVQRVGFYIPVVGSAKEDVWAEIVKDLSG